MPAAGQRCSRGTGFHTKLFEYMLKVLIGDDSRAMPNLDNEGLRRLRHPDTEIFGSVRVAVVDNVMPGCERYQAPENSFCQFACL